MVEIIKAYGMGPNLLMIVQHFWEGQCVAVKQRGMFGKVFKGKKGVTQGDIVSPTIFNIMVDEVVRVVQADIADQEAGQSNQTTGIFYADDGYVAGTDGTRVQQVMQLYTQQFKLLGLHMSYAKTKMLIGQVNHLQTNISPQAYHRRLTGEGPSYRQRMS